MTLFNTKPFSRGHPCLILRCPHRHAPYDVCYAENRTRIGLLALGKARREIIFHFGEAGTSEEQVELQTSERRDT